MTRARHSWKHFPAFMTDRFRPAHGSSSAVKPLTEENFLRSAAAFDSNLLHTPLSQTQWELLCHTPVSPCHRQ